MTDRILSSPVKTGEHKLNYEISISGEIKLLEDKTCYVKDCKDCIIEGLQDRIKDLEETQLEYDLIANIMHYPRCWEEHEYPTLLSAITEGLSGCNTCGEVYDNI